MILGALWARERRQSDAPGHWWPPRDTPQLARAVRDRAQADARRGRASRRGRVATIGLNLVSGVLTGFALLATTGVLEALFAEGPTPDRVRAALPSIILVAAATAGRAGLQAAAGWAQSRLRPQVDRVVAIRLLDLTT